MLYVLNNCSTIGNVRFLIYRCMHAIGELRFLTPIATFIQCAIYAYFKRNSKPMGRLQLYYIYILNDSSSTKDASFPLEAKS